ncbi:restriction endonuclease subunit S [Anaerovibrio lipolyticus]|uniref:restriction endonuclease subunit S n=1 Tax=Anaerovibrio lipolyticus TaxID=82374 RepID=UPI000691975D|nr:restriction endonuclease subunit S [Anaerovibrio lipolyticus]
MREKFCKYFDVISGYAFKSTDLKVYSDVPVIKIGNISNGADLIEDDSNQYVSKDFLKINEKYHINKDDILISLTGSHINQPNSMVGRVCRSYRDKTYLLNQRAGKVIPKDDASKEYLFYLLSSKCIKEEIVNRAYGAANQVNISPSAIGNIKWDFPSLDKQKKIGELLSFFDKLIIINNKRIKILEQMAEKLYKEWFVRFRFPGYENAEFVDGVPKRWKIVKLDEYVYIRAGGDRPKIYSDIPTENCAIPIFSNGIENDGLYGYTEKPIIEKESITISARGTVGFVCLRRVPFCPIVRLLALTPKQDHVTAIFLYYLLKNDELIGNGTSQQQITIPMVKKKKFLKPVSCLIKQFTEFADQCWNEIDVLKQQNQNLIKQRDYLLPRLMSGKIKV